MTQTIQAASPAILDQPAGAIIVASEAALPANPAVILAAQQQPARKRSHTWFYIGGAIAALQIIGPYEVKPTTLVGGVMADWVRQTTAANVENQLLLAKSQKLAESVAELEASYAYKIGQCNLTILFGPEAMSMCVTAVRTYHEPALEKARAELAVVEKQLRRR